MYFFFHTGARLAITAGRGFRLFNRRRVPAIFTFATIKPRRATFTSVLLVFWPHARFTCSLWETPPAWSLEHFGRIAPADPSYTHCPGDNDNLSSKSGSVGSYFAATPEKKEEIELSVEGAEAIAAASASVQQILQSHELPMFLHSAPEDVSAQQWVSSASLAKHSAHLSTVLPRRVKFRWNSVVLPRGPTIVRCGPKSWKRCGGE